MKTKYSEEFRESIIAKLLAPQNAKVSDVAQETGIPKDTLYCWRAKYRNTQSVSTAGSGERTDKFSSEDKLSVVIETASLGELELGEYCRRKGLYPEQVITWKKAFIQGVSRSPNKVERKQAQQQKQIIKKLQSELHRKEKALAEAAALLILEKKLQALWEDPEDERLNSWSAKK